MRPGRVQSLHPLCTVQLLSGFDLPATEYLFSQCATEREIIVVRSREKETQMEKGRSDGIIGELIDVRLGNDEQSCFCAQQSHTDEAPGV